jgi:hypothetical protein
MYLALRQRQREVFDQPGDILRDLRDRGTEAQIVGADEDEYLGGPQGDDRRQTQQQMLGPLAIDAKNCAWRPRGTSGPSGHCG